MSAAAATDAALRGWLAGYRALDLTDERGALAGQMLGKLGVDVIQVEPLDGTRARRVQPLDERGHSFFWSAYGACKRSVTLALEHEEARELLLRLVEVSDFFLESMDADELSRLRLSYDDLRQRNSKLIYVSVSPFGRSGPKRDYADADLILWAAGGPLQPNTDGAGAPLRICVPQAYLHGAADAAGGALIALFARHATGQGQHVEVSVQQSVTQSTLGSHLSAAVGHEDFSFRKTTTPTRPAGPDLSGSGARTRRSKWTVRDGLIEMHLSMGPAAGRKTNHLFAWMREAGALPEALHDWDWVRVPDALSAGEIDHAGMEVAREAVARFLAGFTKQELLAQSLARDLLIAPVNELSDLLGSEHLRSREFFAQVDEAGVPRTIPGAFASGPRGMFAVTAAAPALGAHRGEILGGLLGLPDDHIARLRERGLT